MDPIAHTFTGAALAASGLRRATPLATAALILGANAPDIDILAAFGPDFSSVAHRRGWTHGLPAMAVFPFLVTGLLLAWNRFVRCRLTPGGAPIRAGPLLGVTAIGVASHPTLDWLNNYGMRWLMPFDGRWFYGDALFIIDPWVWLALGGSVFLMHSRRAVPIAAWCGFWLLATVLVFATADVPQPARWLWVAGLAAVFAARATGLCAPRRERAVEWATRAALVMIVAYMGAASLANAPARTEVRDALASRGLGPVERIMIGPVPANPFAGEVVAQTPDAYHTGRWSWFARPRFELASPPIPRPEPNELSETAAGVAEVRRFLIWARFPYFEIETLDSGGHIVRFRDARYLGTDRLGSPAVLVDGDHEPQYIE